MMSKVTFVACLLAFANAGSISAYFANWAQYHVSPYTHTPESLAPIVGRLDTIIYSFIYFCPPSGTSPMPYWAQPPYGSCTDSEEYTLLSVEAKDAQFIPAIVAYKQQNPNLKVVASIGGWNFPSGYWSTLVSSADNRAKFVASVKQWASQYSLDGVDIDWEYPCSPARDDPVKITCAVFRHVADAGGKCPDDTNNFPLLLSDLRTAMGDDFIISVASQAAPKNWAAMNIAKAAQYVTYFHVMSYDYTVSDIADSPVTAPNAPLFNPPSPAVQWSVNTTVQGYLAAGVPKEKILIGIPYYGHTWYAPGLSGDEWKAFNLPTKSQGECCGPFASTMGAKPGQGCSLCGTYMYSEILAAQPTTFYDNTTQTMIGYWENIGADSYTEAGTWVSYNDPTAVKATVAYAEAQGVGGVFVFDTSEDTVSASGTWTFELTNTIADAMGGHVAPTPTPNPNPNPSPTGTCSGKAGGTYCVPGETTKFMYCPEGTVESCAPGTCCEQSSPSGIVCNFCN